MTTIGFTEFFFQVSKGEIAGHTAVIVGGHNPDIDTAAPEDLWEQGGILTPLTSAEKMNIVSTSVNDAAAGTGAQAIKIVGLDGSHLEIDEIVVTNGTTPVLTVNSYLRVRSLEIAPASAGSAELNQGAITATAQTAGTVQCEMSATHGVSQNSHYTVPAGKTAFVLAAQLFVAKTTAGTLPVVDFIFRTRLNGVQINPVRLKFDTAVGVFSELTQPVASPLLATTDFWIEMETDQNNADVHTRLYIVEVDN